MNSRWRIGQASDSWAGKSVETSPSIRATIIDTGPRVAIREKDLFWSKEDIRWAGSSAESNGASLMTNVLKQPFAMLRSAVTEIAYGPCNWQDSRQFLPA